MLRDDGPNSLATASVMAVVIVGVILLVTLAFAHTLSPLRSGGWGYRLTSGRTAVVMKGGPVHVVNLRRGNRFAVTVDEPTSLPLF